MYVRWRNAKDEHKLNVLNAMFINVTKQGNCKNTNTFQAKTVAVHHCARKIIRNSGQKSKQVINIKCTRFHAGCIKTGMGLCMLP